MVCVIAVRTRINEEKFSNRIDSNRLFFYESISIRFHLVRSDTFKVVLNMEFAQMAGQEFLGERGVMWLEGFGSV